MPFTYLRPAFAVVIFFLKKIPFYGPQQWLTGYRDQP